MFTWPATEVLVMLLWRWIMSQSWLEFMEVLVMRSIEEAADTCLLLLLVLLS